MSTYKNIFMAVLSHETKDHSNTSPSAILFEEKTNKA